MVALTTSFLGVANSMDVYRGLTSKFLLTLTQDGEKYDLTGATVYFTVKCSVADIANRLQKTSVSNGITIATDPRDGTAELLLSAADTQTLDPGAYVFDIVVVTAGGERFLVLGPGTLSVKQSVSRF